MILKSFEICGIMSTNIAGKMEGSRQMIGRENPEHLHEMFFSLHTFEFSFSVWQHVIIFYLMRVLFFMTNLKTYHMLVNYVLFLQSLGVDHSW